MKRYSEGDGLAGYAEVVRFYVELTGQGMRDLMREVQHPETAKRDQDVMRMVEKWEDEYKQAVKQGMPVVNDLHRITILEDIATEPIREKLQDEMYTRYGDARDHLIR